MIRRLALVLAALSCGAALAVPAAAEPSPRYLPLVGALHEHTSYSDGYLWTRPADVFASARGFGLDFAGVSDHSDTLEVPLSTSQYCLPDGGGTPVDCVDTRPEGARKWAATGEQAAAATSPGFSAIRGMEWTSDRFGHINVYFSSNDSNAKVDGGYASMATFYAWLTRPAALGGGGDGLATFNHPGDKKLSASDPGYDWDGFAYQPAADDQMVGVELFNGTNDFGQYYWQALSKGWHVGAVGAEDKGHDRTDRWGDPQWAKTVLLATANTPAALREAMHSRRMYAVLDRDVRLTFTADGEPMGSRISAPAGTSVTLAAHANDLVSRLELLTGDGNGGATVLTSSDDGLHVQVPATAGEQWYVVRALDAGGRSVAYSSPVWVRSA